MKNQSNENNTEQRRPRPLRLILLILVATLGLLSISWTITNFRLPPQHGTPLVRVSEETTFFTEPLDQNGDVAYRQIFLENSPLPISNEQNAFWYYSKVIDPLDLDDQLKSFGHTESDNHQSSSHLTSFTDWCESRGVSNNSSLSARFILACSRPWSEDQLPLLHQWHQSQLEFLPIIMAGIECEKGYIPDAHESDTGPFANQTPRCFSKIEWLLSVDAMHRLYRGELDIMINRLQALHRFANQLDSHRRIESFTNQNLIREKILELSDQVFLAPEITDQQARRLLDFLEAIKCQPDIMKLMRESEIPLMMAQLLKMGRAGLQLENLNPPVLINSPLEDPVPSSTRRYGFETVDWAQVMKEAVQSVNLGIEYERLQQNSKHPPVVFDEFLQLNGIQLPPPYTQPQQVAKPWTYRNLVFPVRCETESQLEQFWLHAASLPQHLRRCYSDAAKLQDEKQLTLLAGYLCRFKLKYGQYPKTLQDLSPDFCDSAFIADQRDSCLRYTLYEESYLLSLHFNASEMGPISLYRKTIDESSFLPNFYFNVDPDIGIWINNQPVNWDRFATRYPPSNIRD